MVAKAGAGLVTQLSKMVTAKTFEIGKENFFVFILLDKAQPVPDFRHLEPEVISFLSKCF